MGKKQFTKTDNNLIHIDYIKGWIKEIKELMKKIDTILFEIENTIKENAY